MGETGNLLLPHWDFPRLIVDNKFEPIDFPEIEPQDHYHQFIDACMGRDNSSASFDYAANLTEAILLGVIANRFPNETLHWDMASGKFVEPKANDLLGFMYRKF